MSPSQSYARNYLLRSLSEPDFALLQPHLERVDLHLRQVLVEPGQLVEHIYFLEGGLCSIVSRRESGEEVEVGIFGRDGMSAGFVLLEAETSPHRFFMQVNGNTALRISAKRLCQACRESRTLRAQLLRFVQAMTVQASETAVANAHYTLPERLARWLLMCHDRIDGDEISLTHEFMASMLGVRRSGVTVTLHSLEGEGAIKARRGLICITDRDRLEQIAGAAYGPAEAEYERLIGPLSRSSAADRGREEHRLLKSGLTSRADQGAPLGEARRRHDNDDGGDNG